MSNGSLTLEERLKVAKQLFGLSFSDRLLDIDKNQHFTIFHKVGLFNI